MAEDDILPLLAINIPPNDEDSSDSNSGTLTKLKIYTQIVTEKRCIEAVNNFINKLLL